MIKNFMDELGDPTFYIQNNTESEVVLSDLGFSVKPFAAADLRESFDVDALKRSSSLRQMLSRNDFKRLTEAEFRRVKTESDKRDTMYAEMRSKAKNPELADAEGNIKETTIDISPKCQGMVEKLKLFYKAETRDRGLAPDQFLLWLQTYTPFR